MEETSKRFLQIWGEFIQPHAELLPLYKVFFMFIPDKGEYMSKEGGYKLKQFCIDNPDHFFFIGIAGPNEKIVDVAPKYLKHLVRPRPAGHVPTCTTYHGIPLEPTEAAAVGLRAMLLGTFTAAEAFEAEDTGYKILAPFIHTPGMEETMKRFLQTGDDFMLPRSEELPLYKVFFVFIPDKSARFKPCLVAWCYQIACLDIMKMRSEEEARCPCDKCVAKRQAKVQALTEA